MGEAGSGRAYIYNILCYLAESQTKKMQFLSTLVFSSGNTVLALLLILLIYMTRKHMPTVYYHYHNHLGCWKHTPTVVYYHYRNHLGNTSN